MQCRATVQRRNDFAGHEQPARCVVSAPEDPAAAGGPQPLPRCGFVSAQSIAAAPPQIGSENTRSVLPERMVKVVSRNDRADDIIERIGEYFAAGTKRVGVIYPTQRLVYVYDSPRQVRILGDTDELDGRAVLPGFRIAVASLFPL
jgi:hypothetical protein